jgi:hypothetical protein
MTNSGKEATTKKILCFFEANNFETHLQYYFFSQPIKYLKLVFLYLVLSEQLSWDLEFPASALPASAPALALPSTRTTVSEAQPPTSDERNDSSIRYNS